MIKYGEVLIRTFILTSGAFGAASTGPPTKSFVVHLAEGVRGDPKWLTLLLRADHVIEFDQRHEANRSALL